MVYMSKQGLKNFIKSRNNIFYIAIFLIFAAVISITIITISKSRNKASENKTSTEFISSEEADTSQEIDYVGVFEININISNMVISVKDIKSEVIVRRMLCSVNDSLKTGEYETNSGASFRTTWQTNDKAYYRYYTDFGNGIVFHSASYATKTDKNSLITNEYNLIGKKSKLSGITLCLNDAKWIFEHCSDNSKITIYENSDENYDLDYIKIPEGITWDPTEVDNDSPWYLRTAANIDGPDTVELYQHYNINNVIKNFVATDKDGNDISSYIRIYGNYDINKVAKYKLKAGVIDIHGNFITKEFTLVILRNDEPETDAETDAETDEELQSESRSESETETKKDSEIQTTSPVRPTESKPDEKETTKPISTEKETEPITTKAEPESITTPVTIAPTVPATEPLSTSEATEPTTTAEETTIEISLPAETTTEVSPEAIAEC